MNERVNEWIDGRTDGWMDGWIDGRTDGWTDGRKAGGTDGRTDGWLGNQNMITLKGEKKYVLTHFMPQQR